MRKHLSSFSLQLEHNISLVVGRQNSQLLQRSRTNTHEIFIGNKRAEARHDEDFMFPFEKRSQRKKNAKRMDFCNF